MEKIGLLFGSFNPIHIGHIEIAKTFLAKTDLNKIWFIVTPKNPFKSNQILMNSKLRLDLVKIALKKYKNFSISDIEFKIKSPYYTINTLNQFKKNYPLKSFHLLIGEDNLINFKKWKNYEDILKFYKIYVYPRKVNDETKNNLIKHPSLTKISSPKNNMSSTILRRALLNGESIEKMVPPEIVKYINEIKSIKSG
ncbi:MAG: nicotinate (nicotinamide) nucleotide adenylyltransferase [Flavobacteriaceae bacterium]|nr:nicotinate (nicotinamide) nucleotide adenylyltransferase [Flavobacteriaceae bacterium]